MYISVDIMIKFVSKYYKDGYLFDGKGNWKVCIFFCGCL